MARFSDFSDHELGVLADSLKIAFGPHGFELGPDEDDAAMLLDLVEEMLRRRDELAGDIGDVPALQALVRRAQAAG